MQVFCLTCGAALTRKPSRIVKTKTGHFFCGRACQNEAAARRIEYVTGPAGHDYRRLAFVAYGRRCLVCGYTGQSLQVDHIQPRARGGTDGIGNLQILCANCHADKTRRERGGVV